MRTTLRAKVTLVIARNRLALSLSAGLVHRAMLLADNLQSRSIRLDVDDKASPATSLATNRAVAALVWHWVLTFTSEADRLAMTRSF